jgi:hypothetical protein
VVERLGDDLERGPEGGGPEEVEGEVGGEAAVGSPAILAGQGERWQGGEHVEEEGGGGAVLALGPVALGLGDDDLVREPAVAALGGGVKVVDARAGELDTAELDVDEPDVARADLAAEADAADALQGVIEVGADAFDGLGRGWLGHVRSEKAMHKGDERRGRHTERIGQRRAIRRASVRMSETRDGARTVSWQFLSSVSSSLAVICALALHSSTGRRPSSPARRRSPLRSFSRSGLTQHHSQGIGKATALHFAAEGARVVIVDLDQGATHSAGRWPLLLTYSYSSS